MVGEGGGDTSRVHRLAVGLSTFKRLLDRRGPAGELVSADPALFRMTAEALRAELRCVGDDLAGMLEGPMAADRPRAEVLRAAVVELGRILTVLEAAVDEVG